MILTGGSISNKQQHQKTRDSMDSVVTCTLSFPCQLSLQFLSREEKRKLPLDIGMEQNIAFPSSSEVKEMSDLNGRHNFFFNRIMAHNYRTGQLLPKESGERFFLNT